MNPEIRKARKPESQKARKPESAFHASRFTFHTKLQVERSDIPRIGAEIDTRNFQCVF